MFPPSLAAWWAVLHPMIVPLFALVLVNGGLWLWVLKTQKIHLAQTCWGLMFGLVGWIAIGLAGVDNVTPRGWLVVGLVTLWGIRLSMYLGWRARNRGTDPRFAAMQTQYGSQWWWRSLFQVFVLQALIAWALALPIVSTILITRPLWWLDGVACAILIAGGIIEALADWQAHRFRQQRQHPDEIWDRGLWRYSRHPNYFGSALVWWGISFFGVATDNWWALASGAGTTALLVFVSIDMLETILASQSPFYAAYQQRTSRFIPWPPTFGRLPGPRR